MSESKLQEVEHIDIPKWKKLSTWVGLIGIILFVSSFILPYYYDAEYLDTVGSLLAGSSFLIIFAGVLLQGDELKLQRRESSLQREELKLQREQLEHQAYELEETRKVFEIQNYNQLLQSVENTLLNLINAKDNIIKDFEFQERVGINAINIMNIASTQDSNTASRQVGNYQILVNRINYMYIYVNETKIEEADKVKLKNLILEHLTAVERNAIPIFLENYSGNISRYSDLEQFRE